MRYIVDIENLQYALQKGCKITKIHRGVKYFQKPWVAPYINRNTAKRQQTTDLFKKDFYKLLNNSFFGKCLESVRKHKNVILIHTESQHRFQTSKPQYKRFQIFSESLVGVEVVKPKITLDKCVMVGFTILERSKNHMFKFFYDVIVPTFPGVELLGTDTDSFIFHVPYNQDETDRRLKTISDHLDFSNFPEDHPLYDETNKSVLGKFKSETEGISPLSYAGLRTKVYSMLLKEDDGRYKKKKNPKSKKKKKPPVAGAKPKTEKSAVAGVKYSAQEKLRHEQFVEVLNNHGNVFVEQASIVSTNHRLSEVTQTRLALSAYDDKRWLVDNVHTRAHGHYLNKGSSSEEADS